MNGLHFLSILASIANGSEQKSYVVMKPFKCGNVIWEAIQISCFMLIARQISGCSLTNFYAPTYVPMYMS